MAQRGVQGYGVPVDRLTPGKVKVEKPTQSDGFDYSQDPLQAALAAIGSLNFNPTQINPTQSYGAGGGAKGPNPSDILAKRKYEDELAKQQRALESYQQMLASGSYRGSQNRMMELLRGQAGTSAEGVEGLYGEAMANIGAGYGDAQRLTNAGYSALQEFLRQNPNNPYANVAVGAGPTQDDLSGLLGAYGVSADPVRAQVAAEGAAAQQGAAGFQNLLNVLGASAQQSDASRLAEMMMSQNYANTSLGSQRAGFESQAVRAKQDALAQIQAQLAQAQMQQEQDGETRRRQIEDAVAAAGGTLPEPEEEEDGKTTNPDTPVTTAPDTPVTTAPDTPVTTAPDTPVTTAPDTPVTTAPKPKPVDVLKARMETANPSLKKKIKKFVAQNPRAGQAKIAKAFPKIAAKNNIAAKNK